MKGLVLAGGGQFGAYEAGAVYRLMSEGHRFQVFAGTSIGAYNCAYLAQAREAIQMDAARGLVRLWQHLTTQKVYRNWKTGGKFAALWKPSLYNSRPAWDLLETYVDRKLIAKSGNSLRVVFADMATGAKMVGTESSEHLMDMIKASAAVPGLLRPVKVNGKWGMDGAVRDNAPVNSALAAGATEIIAVVPSTKRIEVKDQKSWTTLEVALRAIEILMDEIVVNDLEVCQRHGVKVTIIRPAVSPPGSFIKFKSEDIERLIRLGYDDTKRVLESKHGE